MKREEFKKLIKESVKEAIKEELISSLLEVLGEQKSPRVSNLDNLGLREEIRSKVPAPNFSKEVNLTSKDVPKFAPQASTLNSQPGYNPGNASTSGEGSSLPQGEVSINQISTLMNSK